MFYGEKFVVNFVKETVYSLEGLLYLLHFVPFSPGLESKFGNGDNSFLRTARKINDKPGKIAFSTLHLWREPSKAHGRKVFFKTGAWGLFFTGTKSTAFGLKRRKKERSISLDIHLFLMLAKISPSFFLLLHLLEALIHRILKTLFFAAASISFYRAFLQY